jgi:hypothetical protein
MKRYNNVFDQRKCRVSDVAVANCAKSFVTLAVWREGEKGDVEPKVLLPWAEWIKQ